MSKHEVSTVLRLNLPSVRLLSHQNLFRRNPPSFELLLERLDGLLDLSALHRLRSTTHALPSVALPSVGYFPAVLSFFLKVSFSFFFALFGKF